MADAQEGVSQFAKAQKICSLRIVSYIYIEKKETSSVQTTLDKFLAKKMFKFQCA